MAAIVVRDWKSESGVVNLLVFPDGSNDIKFEGRHGGWSVAPFWFTSVAHDAAGTPGTWHWPERV